MAGRLRNLAGLLSGIHSPTKEKIRNRHAARRSAGRAGREQQAAVIDRLITLAHVAAGTIVLVVAPLALITLKGGSWHKRWGRFFAFAMCGVLGTSLFMWQPHRHVFLLALAVVCAYLIYEGYRVIARRRTAIDKRADAFDLSAATLVLLSSAALFVIAVTAQTPLMHSITSILMALAAIGAIFAALDIRAVCSGARTRLGSLLMHISAMIAAYISAVTAFCVINFHDVPMNLRWIVPSAVGSTIIAYFSVQYRKKIARRKHAG